MRPLDKIAGFLLLTRPVNVLIAGWSIGIAGYLCGIGQSLDKLISACIVGALMTAAANGINDYFDIEIDRINKPYRPFPSGRITNREGLIFTGLMFTLAMSLACSIGPIALAMTLFSGLLLYWYSARLKRTVLWGNITVSLVTGLAFLFGGVAVGQLQRALIPAAFSFLMHLGREIIKDMEDITGDAALNARTLPVVHGIKFASLLATSVLAILFVVTWWPWVCGYYGKYYLMIIIAGVQSVLLLVIGMIWWYPQRSTYRRMSNLLKADMLVGLLAIYAGRW